MSEAQTRPAPALLARKGFAAPVDAARISALAPAPALAPDVVSLPETTAPAKATPPQPASLLPLDFLAGRQGADDVSRLTTDQPEAAVERAADAKADQPETTLPKISAKPLVQPPAASPAASPAKPEAPRPDPAWRIDAGAKPAAHAEPRRYPALAVGLLLVLATAGYGYRGGWFETGLQAPAPAESPAVVPPPGTPVPESAPEVEVTRPSVDVVRIESGGAAVIAGRAAPGAELILLDNGTPIGTVQADSYGEWVFVPIDPLPSGAHDFGLVIKKIEGGASVPSLDKMPAEQDTTATGVRELNEPGTAAGAVAAVPVPPRKPDIVAKNTAAASAQSVGVQSFVVQIGSVKTRGGAEREWRTLQRRYPELLSELPLSLDEAKLAGGNTVVRLRAGRFGKQADAADLCARLADKHQDCLVVRTTAKTVTPAQ